MFSFEGEGYLKISLRGLVASDLKEAHFLHGLSVIPLVAVSVSFMLLYNPDAVYVRCSMTRR